MDASRLVDVTMIANHTDQTWAVLAGIEFAVLAVFTAWLVRFFAAKNTPWLACITVFVSWCVPWRGVGCCTHSLRAAGMGRA